ncbi:bifunctional proline dehydrogenase/L-glutamate gamma-semialdehyde dehydrogenase [Microbacterium sp. X-17]|uniref:bifunctional proline dehydrogenase/L-glutamate gamma-semialdehyde dehydrogenase n=1 Tax=Microbacterium sp. X-17 TaxID=3144404 RepID=UPI0031F4872F
MGGGDQTGLGVAAEAIALAERWIAEAAQAPVEASAELLAGVLQDPRGLPFTVGFVDGVMRPESYGAAASGLHRVAGLTPEILPWRLRTAVRVGGAVAPALPAAVVPVARRALRDLVDHLVADARPAKLGPAIERLRAEGHRLNLNLLGEAVLGEKEADRRLAGIRALVERDDVDYVSVKVSAIASRLTPWGLDDTVDEVVGRLLPLYRAAAAHGTFLNLDMEEYRDLDLTIAVFTRLLEHPELGGMRAGIVLQTYLPDALPALRELSAWARQRVASGGAPITIRLVKGANLAMERVEAVLHGWTPAPYDTKDDTDGNYLRCLDEALRPESVAAVHIGVAGHNLFDVAHAWLLAGARGVRDAVQFEMLLGMATGQVQAVSRDVGPVLLYVPVVHPDEFDVAIGYLVRRLEESAGPENFLAAASFLPRDRVRLAVERDRYAASVVRAMDPALRAVPRRTQDRHVPLPEGRLTRDPASPEPEGALTQRVLGIARGAQPQTETPAVRFGGVDFVETAVYASHEGAGPESPGASASGAPGFRNAPDTDPALPENRAWAADVLAAIATSTAGVDVIARARVTDAAELDALVERVGIAGASWGARSAAERAQVLRSAGRMLESRRGALVEVAAAETGKVLAEGDVEVSEAVDYANYYASTALELDSVGGAVFVPSRVTVVAPPWNFPVAIPAGGLLAALAAGSGVVLKPAPQARRTAAVLAEALWDAGVPREVLALVDLDEDALGRALVTHPAVDRVILTGSWETAALFRSWRHDLPLHAETSGKNAMIVTPSADLDLAVADLVRSAFSHAGQKCSAASLAILVGPVARSPRFARQLVDAVTSLRVGWPTDPRAEVPPLIEEPRGKLAWALSTLGEGERWLVEPREIEPRLWSPGIRTGVQPGSRFHTEEFFGPVLGIMTAGSLAEAIDLQNAVEYGLTAGLHTREPADLALWLERVQAGNLSVNRGMTGAIVQRQPFGGWKRSAVGPGAKPGGPNHLVGLGSWRASAGGAASSTLHLRGLDTRMTSLIESAQPSLDYPSFEWLRRAALSDAVAWDREFGRVRDVSGLGVERNLLRYRPMPVAIRATADAPLHEVLRAALAGIRAASEVVLSSGSGLPAAVRRALAELGVPVFVETDAQWCERMSGRTRDILAEAADEPPAPRPPRARLVGPAESVASLRQALAEAVEGDPDLAVYAGEVTTAGRLELLPFLREQSISITAHRFGTPDPWSESVI